MYLNGTTFETKEDIVKFISDNYVTIGFPCPIRLSHTKTAIFRSIEALKLHLMTHNHYELESADDLSFNKEDTITNISSINDFLEGLIKPSYNEEPITSVRIVSEELKLDEILEINDITEPIEIIGEIPDEMEEDVYIPINREIFHCINCLRMNHDKCVAKTCLCEHWEHWDDKTVDDLHAYIEGDNQENFIKAVMLIREEKIDGIVATCRIDTCKLTYNPRKFVLTCLNHIDLDIKLE